MIKKWYQVWLCLVKQCLIWFKLRWLSRILAISCETRILSFTKIGENLGICYQIKVCPGFFALFVFFGIFGYLSCRYFSQLIMWKTIWLFATRYQKYQKIYIYIDIWEIILYRETNPSRLKTKNISSLTFIRTNINVNDLLFKTKL